MEASIVGMFILICYLLLFLFQNNFGKRLKYHIFIIAFMSFVDIGYIIKVNTTTLNFDYFASLLFITDFMFYSRFKFKINNMVYLYIILLIVGITSLFIFLLIPPNFEIMDYRGVGWDTIFKAGTYAEPTIDVMQFKLMIRYILYILVYISIYNLIRKKITKPDIIINLYLTAASIVMILGFSEGILSLVNLSDYWNSFIHMIFGESYRAKHVYIDMIGPIYGLTSEPSHYIYTLIPAYSLIMFKLITGRYDHKKSIITLFVISLLTLLINRSLTGVLFISVLIASIAFVFLIKLFIHSKVSSRTITYLIMTIIIVSLVLLMFPAIIRYVYLRISTLSLDEYSSIAVRWFAIRENLQYFLRRPIFGIGIGISGSQAFWPTLLSNTGVLGFVTYLSTIVIHLVKGFKVKHYLYISYALILTNIAFLFSGTIVTMTNPMLAIMYALVIAIYSNQREESIEKLNSA